MSFLEHITKRGYSEYVDAWLSPAEELVYFKLWGWNNKLVGYQRYDWRSEKLSSNKGRYYTYSIKGYEECCLYGLRSLTRFPSPSPLFIVEGAWNAVTCHNNGYAALATLTATPSKSLRDYILAIAGNRRRIALLDNDAQGTKQTLSAMADFSYKPEYGKDVNDLHPLDASLWLDELDEKSL